MNIKIRLDEPLLARKVPSFIPELDLVAEFEHQLVGNIIYSKAKVVAANGTEHEVISFCIPSIGGLTCDTSPPA
jgi:hypothetical protein